MAFTQRESAQLTKATKRLTGLKAIDPTGQLDLGNGHTIPSYQDEINAVQTSLDTYNEARKTLDGLKNELDAAEKALRKKSSAMLTAVGLKFTTDSIQYEQVGGVRTSERKRSPRKAKAKA